MWTCKEHNETKLQKKTNIKMCSYLLVDICTFFLMFFVDVISARWHYGKLAKGKTSMKNTEYNQLKNVLIDTVLKPYKGSVRAFAKKKSLNAGSVHSALTKNILSLGWAWYLCEICKKNNLLPPTKISHIFHVMATKVATNTIKSKWAYNEFKDELK